MSNWTETLTNLNYILAALFPMSTDATRLAATSGIPITYINFQPAAINNWFEILQQAKNRQKVPDLIRAALKDYPEHPELLQALKGELTPVKGPMPGEDLPWHGEPLSGALEQIMDNQNTLLPINFLEVGLYRARSVARVVLPGDKSGSGFLIRNNLFVTNHHVIRDAQEATLAKAQFNYQKTPEGLDILPTVFDFAPDDGFATSPEDDWTVVRLRGDGVSAWGAIPLAPVKIKATERVNIIQHPGGGPKQIALYHNVVTYADTKRTQYLTDTLPGSSGSPVFDSQWRLVAIHHSGGWMLEPGTKKQVFRNEGISCECFLAGLQQSGL